MHVIFLFSTVLNKIFYKTFTSRTNNNRIYKNKPVQKFAYAWVLKYLTKDSSKK